MCDLGQHHNLKLPPHVFERNPDENAPHKWLVSFLFFGYGFFKFLLFLIPFAARS